jgi:replicative DNA helicase
MIAIDYAQLVQVGGKDGIFQRSEAVANELRVLTHKHKVVTVVVSQLNRDGKKLSDTPPTRHYLQGGGAWENNANQIVLIDHTLQIKDRENDKKYTRIIMDKNRHGDMPVQIPVAWNLVNMRWDEEELPSNGEEASVEIAPVEEVAPHPHDEQFGEQQTFMEA